MREERYTEREREERRHSERREERHRERREERGGEAHRDALPQLELSFGSDILVFLHMSL